MNKNIKKLNIYSQNGRWEEVVIIGSKESLIDLRNTIQQALDHKEGICITKGSDTQSQEYDLMVVIGDNLDLLKAPYNKDDEYEDSPDTLEPWDCLTPKQQDRVQEYWDHKEYRNSSIKKRKKQDNLINKIKNFLKGDINE